jgi:hypothetical protein
VSPLPSHYDRSRVSDDGDGSRVAANLLHKQSRHPAGGGLPVLEVRRGIIPRLKRRQNVTKY